MIGSFQSYRNEVDPEGAATHGFDVVRRISGGGAMLMAPDRSSRTRCTCPHRSSRHDLRDSYAFLDDWVLQALRSLGIDAVYQPLNDIASPTGKIGGAAQKRLANGGVLHHATLSYDIDGQVDDRGPSHRSREAQRQGHDLRREARRSAARSQTGLERAEIIERFKDTFRSLTDAETGSISADEYADAEALVESKFATEAWLHRVRDGAGSRPPPPRRTRRTPRRRSSQSCPNPSCPIPSCAVRSRSSRATTSPWPRPCPPDRSPLVYLDPALQHLVARRSGRWSPRGGRPQLLESPYRTSTRPRNPATARGRPDPDPRTSAQGTPEPETEVRHGFHGHAYERVRGMLRAYDDRFDDYGAFLMPRLEEAWRLLADDGTLYLHLDYREAHYAKVMLDAVSGRDCFLNELIWAYDYGAKSRSRWPTKHDTILVYVKNPREYVFNSDEVDREPYMAPGLVTPRRAARGKLPTDVWWHTIVPTTGGRRPAIPRRSRRGSFAAS